MATNTRPTTDSRPSDFARETERYAASLAAGQGKNESLSSRLDQIEQSSQKRRVVVQPFFYFLFLISVIGNAYLIFETSNLRRKFRNMIASVRATKVSPQAIS